MSLVRSRPPWCIGRLNCSEYRSEGRCNAGLLEGRCCETCHGCSQECLTQALAFTTTTTEVETTSPHPHTYKIVMDRYPNISGCVSTQVGAIHWYVFVGLSRLRTCVLVNVDADVTFVTLRL